MVSLLHPTILNPLVAGDLLIRACNLTLLSRFFLWALCLLSGAHCLLPVICRTHFCFAHKESWQANPLSIRKLLTRYGILVLTPLGCSGNPPVKNLFGMVP